MKLTDLKHRYNIGELLDSLNLNGNAAEIGVAYGEHAEKILEGSRLACLYLVDPWRKQDPQAYIDGSSDMDFEACYQHCLERLSRFTAQHRTRFYRMPSSQAARQDTFTLEFFDYVYLDGVHHNPQFQWDLEEWYPLVKPGGIFGGHDYYDCDVKEPGKPHYLCEVKSTVDAWAKNLGLPVHETKDQLTCEHSWWIQKPEV